MVSARPRTPLGGTIRTLRESTERKRWGASRKTQVAVCGALEIETKRKAKALPGVLGGTGSKGTSKAKATGRVVKKRAGSET